MIYETVLQPLISIIIPVYNRVSLVEATLDSVLYQSYNKWECIIVDDGSTDDTKRVLQKYLNRDSRFNLYERPDYHKFGGNGARNYGFDMSIGDYIQFLDSDDLLALGKLEIQIKDLLSNPSCNYSICESNIFFNSPTDSMSTWFESKADSNKRLHSYIKKKLGIQTGSPLFRRNFLERVKFESGLFNEDLKQSQEWELFCRILAIDPFYSYNSKTLLYIRKNSNSITSDYFKSHPHSIESQIKALELVFTFLKARNELTPDLNTHFINSGITIMKKIIDKELNDSLKEYCDKYILNCLPDKLFRFFFKMRYELGKWTWAKFHRGHFLLRF
jgi:glycosyltransferase involved in cell wall biosynthesis